VVSSSPLFSLFFFVLFFLYFVTLGFFGVVFLSTPPETFFFVLPFSARAPACHFFLGGCCLSFVHLCLFSRIRPPFFWKVWPRSSGHESSGLLASYSPYFLTTWAPAWTLFPSLRLVDFPFQVFSFASPFYGT